MAMRNHFYVDFEGGFSSTTNLEDAKFVADRKAREFGYARVTRAKTEHGKILDQELVYEAGKQPETRKGWLSSRVPWLGSAAR